MDSGPGIGQVRKHVARENTAVALFSFSAASIVFLVSYLLNGAEGREGSLFSEAQTVVMILLVLLVIQSVYYLLVARDKLRMAVSANLYSVLDSESTYFIAFAALASSCVYGIYVVGHLANSVSALTAASILALLFVIQLAYFAIRERRERNK